jgi:hypothetical protein
MIYFWVEPLGLDSSNGPLVDLADLAQKMDSLENLSDSAQRTDSIVDMTDSA